MVPLSIRLEHPWFPPFLSSMSLGLPWFPLILFIMRLGLPSSPPEYPDMKLDPMLIPP